MALGRVKTWVKETLTFQDLNIEFNNILNNATTLISPATGSWDLDGNSLVLDSDGDTALVNNTGNTIQFQLGGTVHYIMTAAQFDLTGKVLVLDDDGDSSLAETTDDVVTLTLQSFASFIFDGDVASPVNGLTFTTAATGAAPTITSHGETDVGITVTPKGSGILTVSSAATVSGVLTASTGITSDAGITATTITASGLFTATTITASGLVTANAGITVPTGFDVTLTDAPSSGTDAANKTYVDTKDLTVAILAHQETSGTNGGTATSGSWEIRTLNAEQDTGSIVTLAANVFTLGAGSYSITFSAVGYACNDHQTRLWDVTGSAVVAVGGVAASGGASTGVGTLSAGAAFVTPAGSNDYRIETQVAVTRATDGYGEPGGFGTEQYVTVNIIKIA